MTGQEPAAGYVASFEPAMRLALAQARAAGPLDDVAAHHGPCADVPVGAVILAANGAVLAQGHNLREATADPTAHAEVVALRAAGQALRRWRLEDATLVVTLEPCTMCAGALLAARVARLVFGAADPRAGAAGSALDVLQDPRLGRPVEVIGGVLAPECATLLQEFFARRRDRH